MPIHDLTGMINPIIDDKENSMKSISYSITNHVQGGCGDTVCPFDNTCPSAANVLLHSCTMSQLHEINQIFKSVLLDPLYTNASDDEQITALLQAVQAHSF